MQRFLPFFLVLFIIAAILRIDFFFTVVYLIFAVYLLSRLWTERAARGLRAERDFAKRAFSGDRITVDLTMRNEGWLPLPWLEIQESLPVNLGAPPLYQRVISLGAHEHRRFTYNITCRRRGYYPIGPLRMRNGEVLGFADPSQVTVESEHIIVSPRVVPLQELGMPTRSPQVALPAPSPLFEDPSRIMGVRDYRQGDSLRRIHWTATAGAGRLLVKQYQPSIARETSIILDLDEADYEQRRRYTATELAIVCAASIANHIIVNEGLPAGLATEAWDPLLEERRRFSLPPRSERVHLMSLLEVLARAEVTAATPFPELLRQESVNLSWGATLAVIAGRESEPLFDTLLYLRRVGFAVALILVQPTFPSDELRKRADMLSMPVRHVWEEQDLEVWA